MTKKIYAIDTETYYDKECSVKTLGPKGYSRHPKWHCYLLQVAGNDGLEWAGDPKDAPWDSLYAPHVQWVMQNAQFDLTMLERLRELEAIPEPPGGQWPEVVDTADLAAFLGHPRHLKGWSKSLLGAEVDKSIRETGMKAMVWADADEKLKEEIIRYGLADAKLTLRCWLEHGHKWPEEERRISELSRVWAMEGLPVNRERLEKGVMDARNAVWKASNALPWVAEGGKALSPKSLALECRKAGIPAPLSLAMDSGDCEKWEETYGDRFPWVGAMRTVRRGTRLLRTLETMLARTGDDGRMPYEIKYFGGHTGRWSGSGGLNVQNMSAKKEIVEKFGPYADQRAVIAPKAGNTLIIADLAQIEPRILTWIVEDKPALDKMAAGISPYIVHAEQTMGKDPAETWEKSSGKYKLAKARCVGPLTPVLTKRGYVPISSIKLDDMVWDGVSWVHHEGIIRQPADKPTRHIDGILFSDDHRIFLSETETESAGNLSERIKACKSFRRSCSGNSGNPFWGMGSYFTRLSKRLGQKGVALCALSLWGLWKKTVGCMAKLGKTKNFALHNLRNQKNKTNPRHGRVGPDTGRDRPDTQTKMGRNHAPMPRPVLPGLLQLRGEGHTNPPDLFKRGRVCGLLQTPAGREKTHKGTLVGSNRQRTRIRAGEFALCYAKNTSQQHQADNQNKSGGNSR